MGLHSGRKRAGAVDQLNPAQLLPSQLLYFGRYGRLFLPDVALLGDRELCTAALTAAPIAPAPA